MIISMKKIFSRNKGFTLVECIIAVAVFGLLALIVFMILTNASVRAARASESEENLAQLIENVVGDETYKKYDSSSKNLTLLIDNVNGAAGTGNLTVSYNVISGYKNFIECPSCSHQANFTDFMSSTIGQPTIDPHMTPVDSLNFDTATCYFVCPSCYDTITFTLRCPDCSTTDVYNKTSSTSLSGYLFTYMKSASGAFECSVCGGTAVMAVDAAGNYISEKVSADGFNVSGMVANGIRYGESIDWVNHDTSKLCSFLEANAVDPTISGTQHSLASGDIRADLSYAGSTNSSFAGTYTLGLHVYNFPSEIGTSNPYFIEVVFPIGYTINYDETYYSNVTRDIRPIGSKTYPTLKIRMNAAGTYQNVQFTLTSNESGYSFEYDYNPEPTETDQEQGLFRWFGFHVPTPSRNADGYLVSASTTLQPIGV